jgi:hypothetical protein
LVLDSHQIIFSGLAEYTADSMVRVRIYDPYNGFGGNSSICKFVVYSDTSVASSIETRNVTAENKVYPNPFIDKFAIQLNSIVTKNATVQMFDVLGRKIEMNFVRNSKNEINIDADGLLTGMYYLVITDSKTVDILWSHQVIKE